MTFTPEQRTYARVAGIAFLAKFALETFGDSVTILARGGQSFAEIARFAVEPDVPRRAVAALPSGHVRLPRAHERAETVGVASLLTELAVAVWLVIKSVPPRAMAEANAWPPTTSVHSAGVRAPQGRTFDVPATNPAGPCPRR